MQDGEQTVTRLAEVLDDLLGLPSTWSAVNVLEGRQRAPCNALGGLHHPLESYVVEGGAIAVLGGDAAQQNALNGASVEVCEGPGGHVEFLHPSSASLRQCLYQGVGVLGPFQVISDDAFGPLYCGPVDVDGGVLSLRSPVVHIQLLLFFFFFFLH